MQVGTEATPRVEVVCAGNHREMGLAQGSALRAKILGAIHNCSQQQSFRIGQPWWLPDNVFLWLARFRAAWLLAQPLEQDFPETNERLAGIAEGAGLGLRTIYLINAIEPIMSSVKDRSVVPSMAACSAVAVRGRRSASGEPIITRNFDYLPFIQPYFTLRENRPQHGHRSLDFTVATMSGTVDGMNEKGLCITYNYAYTIDEGPPSAPISMLITEAIARCATVTEAADWIISRPRWGGGILMLADASGDIAALELSNTQHRLRRPEGGSDLLLHTNQFHCPQMQPYEVSHRAIFNERAHPAMRGRRVLESAELRTRRLTELLRGFKAFTSNELTALMADHGPHNRPSDTTVCVHGQLRATNACLQLFPRSRRMRVAYDSACRAQYQEFEI